MNKGQYRDTVQSYLMYIFAATFGIIVILLIQCVQLSIIKDGISYIQDDVMKLKLHECIGVRFDAETYYSIPVTLATTEEIHTETVMLKSVRKSSWNTKCKEYFGYVPNESEIHNWIQLVMDETGHSTNDQEIRAVADIIANRCKDSKFPSDIWSVISQPNQFSPVTVDGRFGTTQITDRVTLLCLDQIMNGPITEATFFTVGYYNPYSTQYMYRIGSTYFSR